MLHSVPFKKIRAIEKLAEIDRGRRLRLLTWMSAGMRWFGLVALVLLWGSSSAWGYSWDSATRTIGFDSSATRTDFVCEDDEHVGVTESKLNVNGGCTATLYGNLTFYGGYTLGINSPAGNPTFNPWGTLTMNLSAVYGTAVINVYNGTLYWENNNKVGLTSGSTINVKNGATLNTRYLFRQASGTATTINLESGSTWNLNSVNTGSGHNADDALVVNGGGGLIIQGSGTMNIASGCSEVTPGGGTFSAGKVQFKMSSGGTFRVSNGAIFRNGGENAGNKHADWSANYGNLDVNGTLMFWDSYTSIYAYGLSGASTGKIGFGTSNATGTLYLGNHASGSDPGGTFNYYGNFGSPINNDVVSNVTGTTLNLVKNGRFDQRLHGANTYTGGTTINDGVLTICHSSALGTGDVTLNGGTLKFDDQNLNVANNITITSSNTSFRAGGTAADRVYIASGKISGNQLSIANECGRAITLANSGNDFNGLRIGNGLNSISNTTRYAAVAMGANNSLGQGVVTFETIDGTGADVYASLDMAGYSTTGRAIAGLTGGNSHSTLTNSSSTLSTLRINVAENASYTYGGKITGKVAITKEGAGTQTLVLSDTDSRLSGSLNVAAGTLVVDRSGLSALEGDDARPIFYQDGTLNVTVNGTLKIKSAAPTADGHSVNAGHYTAAALAGTLSNGGWHSTGTFNLYGSGTFEIAQGRVEFFRTDVHQTVTVAMSDGGSIQVDNGAEFRTGGNLNNGQNTVSWSGNKGDLNIKSGGKFIMWDDTSVYFDALNGDDSDTAVLTSGGGTASRVLYIGVDNGNGNFGGTINDAYDGTQRTISVVKQGTGTQILQRSTSYHGGTTIQGGTLQADSQGTFGYGAINIGLGAALVFNNSLDATHGNAITGAGSITYQNGRSYTQVGAIGTSGSNYAGTLNVASGTSLQLGNSSYNTASYISGSVNSAGTLAIYSGSSLTLNGATNTIATLGGDGTLTLSSGKALSLGTSTGTGGITNNGALTITGAGTIANAISGTGTVTVTTANSSDVVSFATTNTYGGNTTITQGTLQATNEGTFGTAGMEVRSGAALVFSNSLNATHGNTITGAGSITYQNGRNYTQVGSIGTSSSNFTGTVTIASGTSLQLGNASYNTASYIAGTLTANGTLAINSGSSLTLAAIAGSGAVTNNGALIFTAPSTVANAISGNGTVTVAAANSSDRVIFTNANTYSGTTTITRGELQLNRADALRTSAQVSMATEAKLILNYGGESSDHTFGQIVTGAGTIVHHGQGTERFASGLNDFTGTILVDNGGTMVLATGTGTGARVWVNGCSAEITTGGSVDTVTVDDGFVVVNGGSVGTLELNDTTDISMISSGSVGSVTMGSGSTLDVTGGSIDELVVGESAILNLTGNAEDSLGRLILGDNAMLYIAPENGTSTSSDYNVAHDLLLGSGIALEIELDDDVIKNGMYDLMTAGSISGSVGSFSSVTVHQSGSTMTFTNVGSYLEVTDTSIRLNTKAIYAESVPEPGTWLLMVLGLLGVGLVRRRR